MAKIYLSSTYADLKDYREAVYDTLRKVRHDVIAMEDYVATDERPADKCLADVASCNLYVGLIAWRYGYVPAKDNPENRSITEMEFCKAGDAKIPRLMFLTDKNVPWPDEFRDTKTGDNGAGQRVVDFRDEVGRNFTVSHFKNPDQLAGLVLAAVYHKLQLKAPVPSPVPSFREVKIRTLEKQFKSLVDQYEAVSGAIDTALDPAALVKLKQRLGELAAELEKVEAELAAPR